MLQLYVFLFRQFQLCSYTHPKYILKIYIIIIKIKKIMITRILKYTMNNIIRYIPKQSRYNYTEYELQAEQMQFDKELSRVEKCSDFNQLNGYLSKNKDHLKDQLANIFLTALRLKKYAKPLERGIIVVKIINNMNIQVFSVQEIGYLCALIPFLQTRQSVSGLLIEKIKSKLKQYIKMPSRISNQHIIYMLGFTFDQQLSIFSKKLIQTFIQRIPTLSPVQCNQYLQIISRRKQCTNIQKKIFEIFYRKYYSVVDQLDLTRLFNGYKCLKIINKTIFTCIDDLVQQIEQKIKNNINQFNQKQLMYILSYKSQLNPFIQIIFEKIMQSIQQNGNSKIHPSLLFKLLKRILSNKKKSPCITAATPKLLRFIQKNLMGYTHIISIIKKQIFSKQQLTKLAGTISQSQHRNLYLTNSIYIYQLLKKNILQPEEAYSFIEVMVKNKQNINNFLSQYFISCVFIVSKLLQKDKQNPQLQQIHEFLIKIINNMADNNYFMTRLRWISKLQYYTEFHKNYTFLDKLSKHKLMNQQKQIPKLLFNYLLFTNQYQYTLAIIQQNKHAFQQKLFLLLIERVNYQPIQFVGCFNFVNKLLKYRINSTAPFIKSKARLWNYICNWQLHINLCTDQITQFLNLTLTFVKISRLGEQLGNFITYFIKTPQKLIKINPNYLTLLQKCQKQVVLNYKRYNADENLQCFYMQLIKINKMSKQLAEVLTRDMKVPQFIRQYAKIVLGNKKKYQHLKQVNSSNITLIVRCEQLTKQIIEQLKPQILNIVNKLDNKTLQTYLINYQIKRNTQILQCIIKKYNQNNYKNKPQYQDIYKISLIIKNLSKHYSIRTQYKIFLQNCMQCYLEHIDKISVQIHEQFIHELSGLQINCSQYITKMIHYYQVNISQQKIGYKKLIPVIEFFLTVQPTSAFNLYINALKNTHGDFKFELLNNLITCNFEDPTVRKQINLILSQNNIKICQPIYRYAVSKCPQLQKYQQNLILQPAKQLISLQNILTKFLTQKTIKYETTQKYGHCMIKVQQRYIFFSPRKYCQTLHTELKNYYSYLFNIPVQKTIILYINQQNRLFIPLILTPENSQLYPYRSELIKQFYNNQQVNKNNIVHQKKIFNKYLKQVV